MNGHYRVAVDVGGTFTDLVGVDPSGRFSVAKVPTTYPDFQRGIIQAIEAAGVSFEHIELLLHGTTLATNAVIARTGAKTGLVGTEGFRDLLEIRRANRSREGMYDVSWDPVVPLIPRRNRLTVEERVDYLGRIQKPLNEAQAKVIGRAFRKRGIESVAICFINSYLCPDNERAMARVLREECPNISITLSSDLIPVILEFERTSTTVVNAYVAPVVNRYMESLDREFRARRYVGEILIMQSSGGITTPEGAGRYAARTIMSGPAAGVMAAKAIGELEGSRNLISFDMGGTSADIATIYNGVIRTTEESQIEFGIPVVFPSIDIATVGAGGGTIAWVDDAGVLKSGPRSAGSMPGPACYGTGGRDATTTDANVILGVLNPVSLAGGTLKLQPDLARAAVQRLANRLALDVTKTASGIIKVTNANMVQAMRQVSTERGYDPREFALIAFGGAGPLHCAGVAAEMSIPKVIVPPTPGLTSALGLLFADVRFDFSKTYIRRTDRLEPAEIERLFRELEARGIEALTAAGFGHERTRIQRIINLKYYGGFEAVPLSISVAGEVFDRQALDAALDQFAAEHEREYKYVLNDVPVEMQRVRVIAIGLIDRPRLARSETTGHADDAATGERDVYFDEIGGFVETKVYDRRKLLPHAAIFGPAVVEQMDSTALIRPGMRAEVDQFLNLVIHTEAKS